MLSTYLKGLGVTLGLVLVTAAHADDAGKQEYMDACASCHGESGAGDGPS